MMKVVLRSDVDGVGTAGAVVDVADGFARNHLIPRGLALRATDGTMAQAAAMARARAVRDSRERETAEQLVKQLVVDGVTIAARAGSGSHLYGSVTTHEIAEAIKARTGVDIDRRRLTIPAPIRTVGTHEVTAKPHSDVAFTFNLEVVALS
ncbi:50S ribosomal protein L9 [Candidatus Poriferisodalis sp.]|uniref:50S ribosomal protein L9 n=1 Tax=Candidatus Poriferisodalis sp. TaxID=3101277 RepID=UPI003D0C6729